VKFCVVEVEGRPDPTLAVGRGDGVVLLSGPASLRGAIEAGGVEGLLRRAKEATGPVVPLTRVRRWLPPVPDPRTFRDFYAFEQHVKAARAKRGQPMLDEWYRIPIFYFSNPSSLRGHLEAVKKPESTSELDYELEVACILGRQVQDVSGDAAEAAIFGYLILNDLSARDLQREEMKCMLGPAKGKDFASAIGPWVVTPDELADVRVGPGRYELTMVARRNGRELSRGNMKDLTHDFTKMIERASRDVMLYPGDLIGSGTVGTGCILELGADAAGGWLTSGDTIELEIDRLGVLTTPIM
jgi:2-keto-4-pentenoate hydratase/2-oxohepta-3-ene-1,7-dioic acid hydratase in catechol pathway